MVDIEDEGWVVQELVLMTLNVVKRDEKWRNRKWKVVEAVSVPSVVVGLPMVMREFERTVLGWELQSVPKTVVG